MRLLTRVRPGPLEQTRREFAALRAGEFARLDDAGDTYLDYTGSGLHAQSQLEQHRMLLEGGLIGNPHSHNPASSRATELIERARDQVLRYFGVNPHTHSVIFTANASAAAKLVAEAYRLGPASHLVLLADNHNSINGIRRFADRAGARTTYLPLDPDLRAAGLRFPPVGSGPSLFAYPAQSNFSGVRHPEELLRGAQNAGYDVLLDAAAFAPTSRLDLEALPVEYACVSFYKMFGYPTGVGALIATKAALARLDRPWFAGGTVDFVSVEHRLHQHRSGAERFEDGTPNFVGIAGVSIGLEFLESVGIEPIGAWVRHLTGTLLDGLDALQWPNGAPMVQRYGPPGCDMRGGTVAFNVLDREGRPRFYEPVEESAGRERIHLRGGCFCNPGAAEAAFGFDRLPVRACLDQLGPGDFSVARFAACLGRDAPTGALRASLGVASNEADIDRLLDFLRTYAAQVPEPGSH